MFTVYISLYAQVQTTHQRDFLGIKHTIYSIILQIGLVVKRDLAVHASNGSLDGECAWRPYYRPH